MRSSIASLSLVEGATCGSENTLEFDLSRKRNNGITESEKET